MKASLIGRVRRAVVRFDAGERVVWRVSNRRYSGRVKRMSPCGRVCNVVSRDGFTWLLPARELERVA